MGQNANSKSRVSARASCAAASGTRQPRPGSGDIASGAGTYRALGLSSLRRWTFCFVLSWPSWREVSPSAPRCSHPGSLGTCPVEGSGEFPALLKRCLLCFGCLAANFRSFGATLAHVGVCRQQSCQRHPKY